MKRVDISCQLSLPDEIAQYYLDRYPNTDTGLNVFKFNTDIQFLLYNLLVENYELTEGVDTASGAILVELQKIRKLLQTRLDISTLANVEVSPTVEKSASTTESVEEHTQGFIGSEDISSQELHGDTQPPIPENPKLTPEQIKAKLSQGFFSK